MEQVVFSFGMVTVVVVDVDSKFLSLFEEMYNALGLKLYAFSRSNHKGLSVERYHRFLNKTQTIVSQDRGAHHSIIENCKTSQYAWNSTPIDNTDISRSMAAVGCHFKYPMDVSLNEDPSMKFKDHSVVHSYLRDVLNDSTFSTSILQVLIE